MRKIIIDVDEWIKDAEEGKYKINTSGYAKGCNGCIRLLYSETQICCK